MGMMNAITGGSRTSSKGGVKTVRKANGPEALRDATLEDGLRHVLGTIENLIELDARLSELEGDLLGAPAIESDELPSLEELGMAGFVPRLMESGLLIGALTRRMHLRLGVLEGALGTRARPVSAQASVTFAEEEVDAPLNLTRAVLEPAATEAPRKSDAA